MTQPEDELPTTLPLYSAPPAEPALTTGQLGKLRDIVGSFTALANYRETHPKARDAWNAAVDVLTAFISECQAPPSIEELKRELEGK
jgi:hypothetical protein